MLAFVCLCMKENGFFRGRYFPKWAHILSRQCFQKKLRQTFKGREAWPKILLQSYKNGMKTFRILIRCIEISNSMLPELDQKLWKGLKNDFESSKNTQIWRKKELHLFWEDSFEIFGNNLSLFSWVFGYRKLLPCPCQLGMY